MPISHFSRITYAMAEAVILDIDSRSSPDAIQGASGFIVAVHGRMQPLYRFGLAMIAMVFSCYTFLRTGRRFSRLSIDGRLRLMREWLQSPIGVMRDFARFFLNMTLLFYYDSDAGLKSLGVDICMHRNVQRLYNGS